MIRTTALLCAAALGLAACGGSSNSSSSSSSSTTKTTSSTASSSSSSASTPHEVEMDDNYFKPKTITGKPGSTVTVELKNEGKAEHTFTIDSQHIDKELEGGKAAKVSFKIPASGSLQFYCKYHKSLGMVGTIKAS